MLVIGSAQAVNIFISILRMKILALLLGPTGVGLLSIYHSFQGMVMTATGLGLETSAVRQIASFKREERTLSRVRRVLLAAHLVQGMLAMLGVWLLRADISEWLFADRAYSTEVGLIGLSILFGLLGSAQTGLLHGMRRIGDLARVTVWSAVSATAVGLAAVWFHGQAGLVWFVVVQPLATILVGIRYTRRLPKPSAPYPTILEVWKLWKPMVTLGVSFMLGGLATTATLLIVRSQITQELGLGAAGQFAAAWGITITYVGFMLGAMAADYYPRLTEVINDPAAATQLINDQAQLGLAISGPVLLLLIGLAPWVISLLYSSAFGAAVELLQWQTVGNIFKIASWPLRFSVVAAARSKTFLLLELSFNVVFLGAAWLMLPTLGLTATAIAFLAGYLVYFATINVVVRTMQGFRWESLSLWLITLNAILCVMLLILARFSPLAAAAASPLLAIFTGLFGLRVVLLKIGISGRFACQIAKFFSIIGWPIRDIVEVKHP